jgi:hypothetical protein
LPQTRIFILVLAVLLSVPGFCQDTLQQKNIKYFNTLSAGALIGEYPLGTTATFSLVNGIRYGRMYAGVGIGYDDYFRQNEDSFGQRITRWNMMPVYLSIGFDFAELKSNHLFFQLNTGYSKSWNKSMGNYYQFSDIKGGVNVSTMVGYRVNPGNYNLSISAGYKWQSNAYSYGYEWFGGAPSPTTDVEESLERVVIQIGIGLH